MSYSRRQLYAMGETLGECVTRKEGGRIVYGGGGGGSPAPAPTQNTTNTSNIPEYAKPYVETMLGATQQQLFNTQQVTDPTTGEAKTEITSVKPYQAFGAPVAGSQYGAGLGPGEMNAARSAYAGFDPLQQQAYQGAANLQVPGQYGQASDAASAGIAGAFGTAGQAGQYGGLGAQYGGMGAQAGMQGQGYGGMGAQYGAQAARAGEQYARQATDPYATQAYMSPYMQNVVATQQREAQRASDILGAQQRGQATQAGAFGGGRQAIMEAERQRNLATQMGNIQATGLQSAYDAARQAQQFGANLGLQGKQAGIQGAQAGMQGAGLGIQGAQAGMQGAQIGLQGVGAQQAGYGQAIQGAGQLGNLGAQQLAAQQGVLGTQSQYGAQQQAYNQNILNQAIQNYAMQQQYPQQQLSFMNAQLRGLPMQSSTTQSYQAPPSYLSQAAGLGMAGYGLSKLGAFGKKGGLPKDFEKKKDDAPSGLQALALSKM